ncbi:MAG: hypothetical protein A3F84_23680 [Candidatus Handelsmanbacteria bacterium RIFCSPLOWO2_12_FULL_64_10]|uniref:Uncharacterized protein n=1 Tax=Handelsmanbacteria sp. (strain RIFCSPLOWO2_12_FULL_64_10) TaxID=1817868 RepID=A0A1F6CJL4_HANXR|nr:MAG: hypothetical protein A3F84_23680 [Candidatus Handelsmanbacteria bacterium RIFCSPLOWO2_12_FULL_64_10]
MPLAAERCTVNPPLSAGEVHFLWWFIQGSVMQPETRRRLVLGWGMCERHAFGALAAEAAFRHGYLHGPAILYEDLMKRAAHALDAAGPMAGARAVRRLRSRAVCLMCELRYGPDSQGFISAERLAAGRDPSSVRDFLGRSERYWRVAVCGRCAVTGAAARCRLHLLGDLRSDPQVPFAPHRVLVEKILARVRRYSHSFCWEARGTDTEEDRAALVSAVGWCGGWRALLGCVGE